MYQCLSSSRYQLIYGITNESLEAIMAGMDIDCGSVVLAIGGSGDQAFAMLEIAKKVIVVDTMPTQIDYMERRREALSKGNMTVFMTPVEGSADGHYKGSYSKEWHDTLLRRRAEYFTPERLDRVREKINDIEIHNTELLHMQKGNERIYATNAVSNWDGHRPHGLVCGLVDLLKKDGIIYFSTKQKIVPNNSVVDKKLTTLARQIEDPKYWVPTVIRRVR